MTELEMLEQALDLTRAELAPSPADDARARQALGLTPPGVSPLARSRGPEAGAWTALRALGKAGALVGLLLMGLSFGGGYWLGRDEGRGASSARAAAEWPPATSVASVPSSDDPPPEAAISKGSPASEDAPIERSTRPRSRSPRKHVEAPRSSRSAEARPEADATPGSDSELALLRRVEKSLRAGDAAFALALIGELDERFSKTQLGEEREAARVMAHCTLGDAGARLRAERFLRERSLSVYAERVREACSISAN